MTGPGWEPVTSANPCPVCGQPERCVRLDRGTICTRTEGRVRAGGAGWFHPFVDREPRQASRSWRIRERAEERTDEADRCFEAPDAASARGALAYRLHVGVEALERLRVGWLPSPQAWTFPMRDGYGRIVGIQRRFRPTGDQRVAKGHRTGVFEPTGLDVRDQTLVICEGAIDTAAALSLGLAAIGRFSAEGTRWEVVSRIRHHRPRRVVIVPASEEDGRRGAEALVGALDGLARASIRTPPGRLRDLWTWKQAGATAGEITEDEDKR